MSVRALWFHSLPVSRRHAATATVRLPPIQRISGKRAATTTTSMLVSSVPSKLGYLKRGMSIRRQFSSSKSTGTDNGSQTNAFMRLLGWYSSCLDSHPLTTKCVTSGAIAFFGDLICQAIVMAPAQSSDDDKEAETANENKDVSDSKQSSDKDSPVSSVLGIQMQPPPGMEVWDVPRSVRFALQGAILVGPVVHAWYQCLAIYVPGNSIARVLSRVALDQFVFHPPFLALRIGFLWFLEQKATAADKTWADEILYEVFPQFLPITWCIWIPSLCINFRFIPLKFQLLFTNMVSLVWNVAFSYDQAKKQRDQHVAKPKALKEEEELAIGPA